MNFDELTIDQVRQLLCAECVERIEGWWREEQRELELARQFAGESDEDAASDTAPEDDRLLEAGYYDPDPEPESPPAWMRPRHRRRSG